MRSSTGTSRSSSTRLGNNRRSVNVCTSTIGSNPSLRAARNQNGDPVSSPKCQAIAVRRYPCGSSGGISRGTSSSEKSISSTPPILSHPVPGRQRMTAHPPGSATLARPAGPYPPATDAVDDNAAENDENHDRHAEPVAPRQPGSRGGRRDRRQNIRNHRGAEGSDDAGGL